MNTSPKPTKKQPQLMSFTDALEAILKGDRVTRAEWENEGEYGLLLSDGFLGIRHENKLHTWKLHQEDIIADDWYVI